MGDDEVLATSNGFILRLDQTSVALQRALDTCNLEVSASRNDGFADRIPAGLAIH